MIELVRNGGAMATVRFALTAAARENAYVNVVEVNHELLLFNIYPMLL